MFQVCAAPSRMRHGFIPGVMRVFAARVSGKRRNVTHPFDLSSYCLRSVSEHVGKAVNQRFWNGNLIVSARNIQEIHKG